MSENDRPSLSSDILEGAAAIAEYLLGTPGSTPPYLLVGRKAKSAGVSARANPLRPKIYA